MQADVERLMGYNMKKRHLVLLFTAAVTAVLSAYSLAAMNQVYKLDFEWYSQYYNRFSGDSRDISRDRWHMDSYPAGMKLSIFSGQGMGNSRFSGLETGGITGYEFYSYPSNEYVYVYCSLGRVASPEYRAKFSGIAQRGGVVEIMVSLNSPAGVYDASGVSDLSNDASEESFFPDDAADKNNYLPEDLIRISKSAFPAKGELHFVIKDQEGNSLYEKSFTVW